MWQLGWSHCQAVQPSWHGLTVFIFWHCMPELPRVSGKHRGSAQKGLGWSAWLPKNSSLQEGQALHILCLVSVVSAPQSIELCHILRFQCPFPDCGCCCNSAWGLMLCRLNRVGLQDQPSPGISAAALCARPGRWGMRDILFFSALILPTFAASFVRCIKKLMVPCSVLCGTRTRRLFATA